MEPVKVVSKVEVMNTTPAQVVITYTDGTGMTMYKSEWDKQNS